jgi:hypothetical protein
MNTLDTYKDNKDKFQSLYTYIVYDTENKEMINTLYKQLETISKMGDNIKKKYLNDRIYQLILYYKNKKDSVINVVILLGKEIVEIALSKKQKQTLKEYKFPKIITKRGYNFHIDYLKDVFFNFNFRDVIHINNKKYNHCVMNNNKSKIVSNGNISSIDIQEYINKLNNKVLLHGVSSILKSLKSTNNIMVNTKNLNKDKILDIFADSDILDVHNDLINVFEDMSNEKKSHLVKFGKDIIEHAYNVKTIYCVKKKKNKIEKFFTKEGYSPNIISVESLEKNDIADSLKRDYNGVIAVMYY